MQHVVTDEVIRRALRAKICPACPHRPVGSESMGSQARPCEGTCTIFANLGALKQIAERSAGDRTAGFERAIRDGICRCCTASSTAGDYCYESLVRTCPLSLYAADVLETIETLMTVPVK